MEINVTHLNANKSVYLAFVTFQEKIFLSKICKQKCQVPFSFKILSNKKQTNINTVWGQTKEPFLAIGVK